MLTDFHECEIDNGGCDQICINAVGDFHCNCSEGYVLNEDGYTCDGENKMTYVNNYILAVIFFQILMNVCLIHVTPMQLVITLLEALPVPVSVVFLEMVFCV